MCPQHGIKHEAAINNSKHWLHTVIAALCFILFCGHINKHGRCLKLFCNKRYKIKKKPLLILFSKTWTRNMFYFLLSLIMVLALCMKIRNVPKFHVILAKISTKLHQFQSLCTLPFLWGGTQI